MDGTLARWTRGPSAPASRWGRFGVTLQIIMAEGGVNTTCEPPGQPGPLNFSGGRMPSDETAAAGVLHRGGFTRRT